MNLWDMIHARHPTQVSLERTEAFEIGDIFRDYFATAVEGSPLRLSEIPNVAPPFERYFLFGRSPRAVQFTDRTVDFPQGSVGVLFNATRLVEGGWSMTACQVCGDERLTVWLNPIRYIVRENGQLVVRTDGKFQVEVIDGREEVTVSSEGLPTWLYPCFLATSILHCKNVSAKQITVPHKLAAARARKGKSSYSYSVLDIAPMRKILKTEGGMASGATLAKALHVCRGHFKDYRDGAGLFGRAKGIYWWEQSLRGDTKSGVHVKDYRVKVAAGAT